MLWGDLSRQYCWLDKLGGQTLWQLYYFANLLCRGIPAIGCIGSYAFDTLRCTYLPSCQWIVSRLFATGQLRIADDLSSNWDSQEVKGPKSTSTIKMNFGARLPHFF